GIEGGALLVIRLDAVQVLLHQAVTSQLAAQQGAMNFVDGSFHELKLLSGGASGRKHNLKHHPHHQNKTLRFMTHAFPPMNLLNIEHSSARSGASAVRFSWVGRSVADFRSRLLCTAGARRVANGHSRDQLRRNLLARRPNRQPRTDVAETKNDRD